MSDLFAPPPDIRRGMPEDEYHRWPAFSAGGAHMMLSECPAIYWRHSPFNPEAVPVKTSRAMDIGTALHLAVLEPEKMQYRVVVIDADDWRTKKAKELRDDAMEAGKVPLLIPDLARVMALSEALRQNDYVAAMLDEAEFELSYFWSAELGEGRFVPCKARADLITTNRTGRVAIGDLKASSSANPEFFSRRAWDGGHYLRSPWYIDGWRTVTGERDIDYWYIVISEQPPHLVTVCKLDRRAADWGRTAIRGAVETFFECFARGIWPPYALHPVELSIPPWAEYRLADREQAGRYSATEIRAAFKLLAP